MYAVRIKRNYDIVLHSNYYNVSTDSRNTAGVKLLTFLDTTAVRKHQPTVYRGPRSGVKARTERTQ